jgi:hypothetical protein
MDGETTSAIDYGRCYFSIYFSSHSKVENLTKP